MDALEFMRRYNGRVDAMGAGAKVKCLGITKKTSYTKQGSDEKAGEACLMATKTQAVSIVHIGGPIQGCIVYSPMSPDKVTDGLVAYSACLDVITGLNEKRRNKLLEKLPSLILLTAYSMQHKQMIRSLRRPLATMRLLYVPRHWVNFPVLLLTSHSMKLM